MAIKGTLKVNSKNLNLGLTLQTGQNFRWSKQSTSNGECWLGVLKNRYVVQLIQREHQIEYELLNTDEINEDNKNLKKILEHYFRLDANLKHLYQHWSKCDENFARICSKFQGIRLLRQDIVENIFSFICSSNNNISRITKMIETICDLYGTKLYSSPERVIYSFPSISRLAEDHIEKDLRNFGFGYRAKFIHQTAKQIISSSDHKPEEWLAKMKRLSYEDVRQELMTFPGIGAKVADCICLMSFGFTEAIPVDTHIWKLTTKLYMPNLKSKNKSLTNKTYNEIGNFYREKFQIHAGWAQTVLFCSELKNIKN